VRAGTRWLTRFDKEVELGVRLAYYALTTGRGRFLSPPSPLQSIPLAIIEPEFSSDPNSGRGVHKHLGAPKVGTGATHPGSTRPTSHSPILSSRSTWTLPICALPTVQRRRYRRCERVRSRRGGQPRCILHRRVVLSPCAEALRRTTRMYITCTRSRIPGLGLC
jgi:hypothetical protein